MTASVAHRYSRGNFDALATTQNGWGAYARSKLANILFAQGLADRVEDEVLVAHSAHPGVIFDSLFYRQILPGPLGGLASWLTVLPGLKTTEQGAQTVLAACFGEESYETNGRYFSGNKLTTPSRTARNTDLRDELWELSQTLTGAKYEE
jgi:NAD(P)-dependent dehydrogenase (short-subunit alcohol dehydrogenase family)